MRYRSVSDRRADEFELRGQGDAARSRTVMLEDDTFIVSKPRTLELANELDPSREQASLRR